MSGEAARAVGVEKVYGDIVAVRSASVAFERGRIHAVCGENGAGKSTLLKMVAGMVSPSAGHVEIRGARLEPHSAREGIRRGVAMVLQHFALVEAFTVLENIVLGAEPVAAGGIVDFSAARKRIEQIREELGVALPLDADVGSLGLGDRQRVEIARALFRSARLLILDEPTAVLTKSEATALYATVRRLADAGTAIVVVTHKIDEVRAHADVVTVMRRGEILFTRPFLRDGTEDAQIEAVTTAIMRDAAPDVTKGAPGQGRGDARRGEKLPSAAANFPDARRGEELPSAAANVPDEASASEARPELLALRDVSFGRALTAVSLSVRAGEIVGIAGVEGNGQRELVSLLAGAAAPDSGVVHGGPVSTLREDRQTEGLVLDGTLRDNLVLGELGAFVGRLGLLDLRALDAEAGVRRARSGLTAGLDSTVRSLSGGNQQKVVVARALSRLGEGRARVLVVAQPTRGVDIGASREIHRRIRKAAQDGAAVLVISADLDELRVLCNRILVLSRGRIVGQFAPDVSDETIGAKMLGIEPVMEASAR